jgi:3-oxoacyl-(acyl-carrier-protein) synthase
VTTDQHEVVITGTGVVSAAGLGADLAWKRLLSGESTSCWDPRLDIVSCRVPDFEPAVHLGNAWARRTDRYSQLALLAAEEALDEAGLAPGQWEGSRVGVVVGTAFGGVTTFGHQAARQVAGEKVSPTTIPMYLPNMLPGQLALRWGALGPSFATSSACASGATAIALGAQLIKSGTCDLVLTGGSDAPITPLVTAAFARMGALSRRHEDPAGASRPFDADRDGFVLSEGAAILVLERADHASGRKAKILAKLLGCGASADAHHITDPHPQGAGLAQAITAALRQAGAQSSDVDHVNAHATGTPKGDEIEARLVSHLLGRHATVTAAKAVLGHSMGASGAIEAAMTVRSISEQIVPPTANLRELAPQVDIDVVTGAPRSQRIGLALSNSSGFGGQNTVLALGAP